MSAGGTMQWIGTYATEDDILEVTTAARERGYQIVDVFTPYAVHGLDRAMGLRPSRITWVCFLGGLSGALATLWLASWTLGVDWPVNIGGKPLNSLPAIIPVIFEVTVLLAGFSSIFALLIRCGLFPGKKAKGLHPAVTDDRFVIVLEDVGHSVEPREVCDLLERCRAIQVEARYSD